MSTRLVLLVSVLVGVAAACKGDPSLTPCTDSAACTLGVRGQCLPSSLGVSLCAYASGDCSTGLAWGDYGGSLAGMCVEDDEVDAGGIDAPVSAFDIAYPHEWRFSVAGPTSGFLLVVNTSAAPLSLSTFQVGSISDDHPTAVVRVTSTAASSTVLPSGSTGGQLGLTAQDLIVTSGLVSEPRVDTETSYLSLELVNAPSGTYDIQADLVIALDGRDAAMPMTIHVVPGPTVYVDPLVVRRVAVYR